MTEDLDGASFFSSAGGCWAGLAGVTVLGASTGGFYSAVFVFFFGGISKLI